MTWNPYPPLPLADLRDLLGIARAMYRAAQAEDAPDAAQLQALEGIGKTLRAVLGAAASHPGTNAHIEAWMEAERATKALRELVSGSGLAPIVEATAKRVSRPGSMG